MAGKTITVTLKRSGIGSKPKTRGTLRALSRERNRRGLGPEAPLQLTALSDGRLILLDPSTGERIGLEAFGATNLAVFAALAAIVYMLDAVELIRRTQRIDVGMGVTLHPRARQAHAIDERGMVQRVRENHIVSSGQRRDQSEVGQITGAATLQPHKLAYYIHNIGTAHHFLYRGGGDNYCEVT